MNHIELYEQAHEKYFDREFTVRYVKGKYKKTKVPNVKTRDGLKRYVINYLKFLGYGAFEILDLSRTGKIVLFNTHQKKELIPLRTKIDGADILASIRHRLVFFKITMGKENIDKYEILRHKYEEEYSCLYHNINNIDDFFFQLKAISDRTIF